MKKVLSLTMVVVMLASIMVLFTACGGDKATFVGKWNAEIDMAKILNEQLNAAGTFGEIELSDISVVMNFEFNDDDTYAISLDEASAEEMAESLKGQLKPIMEDMMAAMLEDTGVTLEDYLAETGTDLDAMMEESFDVAALTESFGDMKGQYLVQDGKLYTSDDEKTAPSTDKGITYEIKGDTIEFVKSDAEDAEDSVVSIDQLLPMVLTKA